MPSPDELIGRALLGHELTRAEEQRLRRHVVQRGMSTSPERLGGRGQGIWYQGRVLSASGVLPSVEAHYVCHVLFGEEWPAGTTLDGYLADIAHAVREGNMFVGRFEGHLLTGFVAPTRPSRPGPRGRPYSFVDYRASGPGFPIGFMMTAYQTSSIQAVLSDPKRSGIVWIRRR